MRGRNRASRRSLPEASIRTQSLCKLRFGAGQNLNSAITGSTLIRSSNSIAFLYNISENGWGGRADGIYGPVMYYLGENVSNAANKDDGTGYGARIGYSADRAIAGSKTKRVR